MPTIRDLLNRFRPAGAPGPAGGAGVPADRVAARSAELESVFARLADAQPAATRIRSDAAERAHDRRKDGAEAAGRIVAEARGRADAVRAEANARARGAAETAAAEVLDRARADAALLHDRVADRLEEYVGIVVGAALREADVGTADPVQLRRGSDG